MIGRWRGVLTVAVFLALVVGAAYVIGVNPYRQIVEQDERLNQTKEQLARLESENTRLQAHLEALDSPEELERLARERLGYVRHGEVSYVVVEPPAEAVEMGTPEANVSDDAPPGPEDDSDSALDRIWDFLTGADLAEG